MIRLLMKSMYIFQHALYTTLKSPVFGDFYSVWISDHQFEGLPLFQFAGDTEMCNKHMIKEKGLGRRENRLDGKEDVRDAIGAFEWRQDQNFPDF